MDIFITVIDKPALDTLTMKTSQGGRVGFRGLMENRYVSLAAWFASIGGMLMGLDQGLMGPLLVMESFAYRFPLIYTDDTIKGWVTSILQLGACLGALINGYVADRISRRGAILVGVVTFCIGGKIQAAAMNLAMIFVSRFLGGVGVGCVTMAVPLFIAEVAPASIRGSLVALQQLSITIGILISFWIDYGTNFIGGTRCLPGTAFDGAAINEFRVFEARKAFPNGCTGQSDASWRVPLAFQIVPAIILGVGILFFPASPRWLMMQGRRDDALRSLAKYRQKPMTDLDVRREWIEIDVAVQFDQETSIEQFPGLQGPGFLSTFKRGVALYGQLLGRKAWRKRFLIAIILQLLQQLTGINAVIFYAPILFGRLGLSGESTSILATGVVGIVNVLATIPGVLYIDRFGRKKVLIVGAAGMCTSHLIIMALNVAYGGPQPTWSSHPVAGWAAAVFIWIFIINFAYSIASIAWIIPSEIFSPSIRSKAMSIATSCNFFFNFIVALVTPKMISSIHGYAYLFFGLWCLAIILYTLFCIPETKGRSVEDMDLIFGDRSGELDAKRMRRIQEQMALSPEGVEVGYKVEIDCTEDIDEKRASCG